MTGGIPGSGLRNGGVRSGLGPVRVAPPGAGFEVALLVPAARAAGSVDPVPNEQALAASSTRIALTEPSPTLTVTMANLAIGSEKAPRKRRLAAISGFFCRALTHRARHWVSARRVLP